MLSDECSTLQPYDPVSNPAVTGNLFIPLHQPWFDSGFWIPPDLLDPVTPSLKSIVVQIICFHNLFFLFITCCRSFNLDSQVIISYKLSLKNKSSCVFCTDYAKIEDNMANWSLHLSLDTDLCSDFCLDFSNYVLTLLPFYQTLLKYIAHFGMMWKILCNIL